MVPILMYHALDERCSPITIAPATFDWQIRWLAENNYQVIPLAKLRHYLQDGITLPERSVVITFDDGFESVYTHAFPTLSAYGFPAMIFLISDFCGGYNDWPSQPASIPRYPLLNWPQIREMERYGIEAGAHTRRHPKLDRLAGHELEDELITSKLMIENQVGHAVEFFAYPYGRYNQQTKALVSQLYTGACSTHLAMVDPHSDPFALERIEALYLTQPYLFRWMRKASLFATYLAGRKLLRSAGTALPNRRWSYL